MKEKVTEIKTTNDTESKVAWIALILALLALGFAYTAFNRAGQDIEAIVQREIAEAMQTAEVVVNEIDETAEQAALRAQVITRLVAIQAAIEANQIEAETEEELAQMRADLQREYANASAEVRQEINEVDQELEIVEQELRNNTATALSSIERSLAILRRDVRSDNE